MVNKASCPTVLEAKYIDQPSQPDENRLKLHVMSHDIGGKTDAFEHPTDDMSFVIGGINAWFAISSWIFS